MMLDPNQRKLTPFPGPIFTFGRPDLLRYRPYLTGDYEMLDILLDGHSVREEFIYVPFSNMTEVNGSPETRRAELAYSTSWSQLIEAFGLGAVDRVILRQLEIASATS
jgi:hypothetical protein